MNKFKREGNRDGGGSFRGKSRFKGSDRGGRSGRDVELFKTTCSACHKTCEVPFRPSGSKPVYCRDCFKENNPGDRRNNDSRGESRSSFRDNGTDDIKRQLTTLESKVDSILALLSSQTSDEVENVTPMELGVIADTVIKKVKKSKDKRVRGLGKKKIAKKKRK